MPRSIVITLRRRPEPPPQADYILDGIGNVLMAFGFRRLSSTYDGPVVRLRRGSDDRELDIDLSGDFLDYVTLYDFAAQSTLYTVTIYDHSGNGRHATQPDPALQPEFEISTASLNNYPTIKGRTDAHLFTTFDIPHSATLLMAYADYVDGSLYGGYMNGFFPRIDNNGWRLNSGGPPEFSFGGDLLENHNIVSLIWDYDADVYKAWLAGTLRVDETTAVDYPLAGGNPGQVMFCAAKNNGADHLQGKLGEAILIDGAIPTNEHNFVGQKWATAFGVNWSDV